jgi:dipeptidyl aminopeptidase/acylaminoacyl peptidase
MYPPTDLRTWVTDPPEAIRKVAALKPPLSFPEAQAAEVSPLLHVGPRTPPICLIHGDRDELVPVEHSRSLYARLQEEKRPARLLVVDGAGHVFNASHYQIAVPAMVEWFVKYLSPETVP